VGYVVGMMRSFQMLEALINRLHQDEGRTSMPIRVHNALQWLVVVYSGNSRKLSFSSS
jgi:hypothetical protein